MTSMRDAVIEMKAAVAGLRDGVARTERELGTERRALEDAERRGALADDIADAETAEVARRFVARHGERAAVLERRLAVQRDELALAERELAEMTDAFRAAQAGRAPGGVTSAERAWRDLEAAGGTRPETDLDGDFQRLAADRKLHEAAVEAQLAHLKKKLGRTD